MHGALPLERFAIDDWRIERWARLGSTNEEARARALAAEAGRVWIVADEQTAGRGRQGRTWRSPPGNLYASALIVDPCEPGVAAQIGFVAGVALRRAVADVGVVGAELKWPNDLVAAGAKLAGLLVEGVTPPGRQLAAVVGIGVNVVSAPTELAYPADFLGRLAARPISPRALFERLVRRFDEALMTWARGAGFAEIREAWLAGAAGLGGPIRVAELNGVREGLFAGVDARGRLIVNCGGSLATVESADITLIPASTRPQEGRSHER